MDAVDLRATEQVTGNLTHCVMWSKVFVCFSDPLVRFCLLYCLRGDLKRWYVKSNVDKEHFEIPKHMQVYIL